MKEKQKNARLKLILKECRHLLAALSVASLLLHLAAIPLLPALMWPFLNATRSGNLISCYWITATISLLLFCLSMQLYWSFPETGRPNSGFSAPDKDG